MLKEAPAMDSGEAVIFPVTTSTWLLLTGMGNSITCLCGRTWWVGVGCVPSHGPGARTLKVQSLERSPGRQSPSQHPIVWMWWPAHAYYPRLAGWKLEDQKFEVILSYIANSKPPPSSPENHHSPPFRHPIHISQTFIHTSSQPRDPS